MKKMYLYLILGGLLLPLSGYSQSAFMRAYLSRNGHRSVKQIAKNFPYDAYLKQIHFTDFKTLQADRRLLWRTKGDGDLFLYYLGEHFINYYPITKDQLHEKIEIGEAFLGPKRGINRATDEIYQTIGLFVLSQVAQKMEGYIKKGELNKNNTEIQGYIHRLKQHKVFVTIEEGTISKIQKNVQQGNYKYILDRAWLSFKGYMNPYSLLCKKNSEDFYISLMVLLFVLGWLSILLFKYRNWKSAVAVSLFVLFLIGPKILPQKALPMATQLTSKPKLKLKSMNNYHQKRRARRGQQAEWSVNLLAIEDQQGKKVGQTIWMQRPDIKATYLAYQDVVRKYFAFGQQHSIVLAASGGFTNAQKQPEGLTVENGNIENAVLMHDRDGLVIVQKGGGIRVLNLKRHNFNLPVPGGRSLVISNPRHSLVAYSQLLDWCRQTRATLFQTQLLAYSDKILIDPTKAYSEKRERRILVLFSDRSNKSGKIHHAIFNLETQYSLAEITNEVYAMVSSRDKKIEAILNLDVGFYNILNVFDENGNLLHDMKGTVDVRKATNLIVYHK